MIAGSKPRAVVIVNPFAGRLTSADRREIVDVLSSYFDLERFVTTARDSAIEISANAVREGAELVIAFGGDGHINEVANGLAGTGATLGIVPGGTMNVFARAVGIPADPYVAVDHLVRRRGDAPRSVSLGRMNGRYFTFSAGCGFDAEAAERVERYLRSKRRLGQFFFFWSAFRVLASSYRHRSPGMMLEGPFGTVPVAMAIACNAGPYAYFLGKPVVIAPDVKLEAGLDVFGLRGMHIEALPTYIWRSVGAGDLANHDDAFYASDLETFKLSSETPFAVHVDGEPLASTTEASFELVRDILRVQA
jgi:diacylglycerol kinase family enzyme